MSRLPVYSQRTYLLDAITALAQTNITSETAGRNGLIEDCLVSLTLEEMCSIVQVQGKARYRNQGTVLDQALDAIERKLYQPDSGQWSQYWRHIRETLKQPASQLEELQARLINPLRQEAVPERQRFEEDVEVPFEILHIPEIDLLISIPVKNRCYIDLEKIQSHEHWVISGDYFPFEIQVGDLTFIVSSAGEIILEIRNFPNSLVREVIGVLREVVQTIYTNGTPHFNATVK